MTCPRFVPSPDGFSCRKPVTPPSSVARLYHKRVDSGDYRVGVSSAMEGSLPSSNPRRSCLSSTDLGRGRSDFGSRSRTTSSKRCHRTGSRPSLSGVLRSPVRRTQVLGRVATSPRLVFPQCVSAQVSVPHGDHSLCAGRGKGGRLGNFNRPYRRLFPCPDPQFLQEVAPFCLERSGLSVSSPSLRSLSRPLGFYPHSERALPLRSEQGGSHQSLPRRLAPFGRFQEVVPSSHQTASGCVSSPRISDQYSEIGPLPFSVLHLPGHGLRHSLFHCPTFASSSSQTPGPSIFFSRRSLRQLVL